MAVRSGLALVAGIGPAYLVKILGKRAHTGRHTFIAEPSRSAHFSARSPIYGVYNQISYLTYPLFSDAASTAKMVQSDGAAVSAACQNIQGPNHREALLNLAYGAIAFWV